MRFQSTFFVLALSTISLRVLAEGINCQGSGVCDIATLISGDAILSTISSNINTIASQLPFITYTSGQHITCAGGDVVDGGCICAFLQNTTQALSAGQLNPLIQALVSHGCETCGSVPTGFLTGDNNVNDGQLTVNYVATGDLPGCVNS